MLLQITSGINISNKKEIEKTLISLFEEYKPEIMALDFEDVRFIDSAGIATLVKILKKIISAKKKFIFYNVSDEIINSINILRLKNFFTIYTKDEFYKKYKNVFNLNTL